MRLFVILLVLSNNAFSQEFHYWTNQFGSRSALMSGAVVGGVRDTSAGFYNPGALGFVKASTFSVSANGYQLESVSVKLMEDSHHHEVWEQYHRFVFLAEGGNK